MVLRQQFLGAGWLPVCATWDAKRLWLFLQACAPSYTSLRFGFVWFFFFFLVCFCVFLPLYLEAITSSGHLL